jgi:hypothetical protein
LANAYQQIVDVEMQLVLDFKPVGTIGECFEPLKCGRSPRTRFSSLGQIERD